MLSSSTSKPPGKVQRHPLTATIELLTFENSRYELGTTDLTWEEANAEAQSKGGKIVEINSAAENAFIFNNFGENSNPIWLGFNDKANEGTFVDRDGEQVVYSNWLPNEPNDYQGNEDYAIMSSSTGKWNDIFNEGGWFFDGRWSNGNTNQLVIEFEQSSPAPIPEPEPEPIPIPELPNGEIIYVSASGNSGALGSENDPTSLEDAINRISPGGTILMRGGTYNYSNTIRIESDNDGNFDARKVIAAYPGETPVLNFSAMTESRSNQGLWVYGDYWHIKDLTVEWAGDNGILVGGSNNIIEKTTTRYNRDTGLKIAHFDTSDRSKWPSNNLILSAVSHDNADSDGEDADGFAASLASGEGNVFRYSVAYNNIDDGWDLYTTDDIGSIGAVTIENSLAYGNGTLSNGSSAINGDRNGFKLGGENIPVDHIIRGNIAWKNGKDGFTYNGNPGAIKVTDNISIDNGDQNFSFNEGSHLFSGNKSYNFGSIKSNDRTVGIEVGSNSFYYGSNPSDADQYDGELNWRFDSEGTLLVDFD